MTQPQHRHHIAVKVVGCFDPADLAHVRQMIASQAEAAGLAHDKMLSVEVAVNELAVYGLRHTKTGAIVSAWATSEDLRITVAVNDHLPPAPQLRAADDPAADHMWLLVSALCERVSIRQHPVGVTIHIAVDRT